MSVLPQRLSDGTASKGRAAHLTRVAALRSYFGGR